MVFALLLGSALLAAGPARETPATPDLAAYEAAKASAGRDPNAQVAPFDAVASRRGSGVLREAD